MERGTERKATHPVDHNVEKQIWDKLENVDQEELLKEGSTSTFKSVINDAIEKNESKESVKVVNQEDELQVYELLGEGIGMNNYLHGSMSEGKKIKLKLRIGDAGLPHRTRIGRQVGSDDEVKCDCGSEVEDSVHVVGECEMYRAEREKLVEEMSRIEGYDESAFIAMDSKAKTVELLGDRQWPEKTGKIQWVGTS